MASKKEQISNAWAALKLLSGDNNVIYYMTNNQLEFGRSNNAFIVINDAAVSRTHCIIKRTNKNFTICDLSNLGTLLNGVRLLKSQPVKLNNADEISICNHKYKFCINNKRLNDAETENLCISQAEELINFDLSHQEKLEKTDEINQMGTEKTGVKQETVRKIKNELKKKLEVKIIEKVQCHIDELMKKEQELLKVTEKRHQEERAGIEKRWKADIAELNRKLEESEQILTATRETLHDCELKQNRLFEEKMEVESKLEATAKHVIDLTKNTENYEMEIQEKEKKRMKAEEESKKMQSLLEGVEDSLICSICMEMFIDPYILGCCHAFCKSCINEWKHNGKKTCPMCRVKITSYKDAFFYEKLISNTEKLMPEDARKRREEIIQQRKIQDENNERAKKRKFTRVLEQILVVDDGPSTSSAQYRPLRFDPIHMHNPNLQNDHGPMARRRRREGTIDLANLLIAPIGFTSSNITYMVSP